MLEVQLTSKKPQNEGNDLLFGDLNLGYYGLVSSAGFITGDDLANAIGMTAGTVMPGYGELGWFKFAYLGKTLYLPKKVFRNNISWSMIYANGSVYGTDTNGAYPPATPVLQNRRVTIKDKVYRVRLMKIEPVDPAPRNSYGRELKELFNRIVRTLDGGTGQWAQYTASDLGIGGVAGGLGQITWGMESLENSTTNKMYFSNGQLTNVQFGSADTAQGSFGWRPILELIP